MSVLGESMKASERNKSIKVEKNLYRVPNPKKQFTINVSDKVCIVHHKGKWKVAFCELDNNWHRVFQNNKTINRTEALKLIDLLIEYVNMIKPTDATKLHSSTKVSARRILRNNTELSAISLSKESK